MGLGFSGRGIDPRKNAKRYCKERTKPVAIRLLERLVLVFWNIPHPEKKSLNRQLKCLFVLLR
jgi:hypothetical protein